MWFCCYLPVNTAFWKMAPTRDDPLKLARSTIPLVKSAPSKLLSINLTITIGSDDISFYRAIEIYFSVNFPPNLP